MLYLLPLRWHGLCWSLHCHHYDIKSFQYTDLFFRLHNDKLALGTNRVYSPTVLYALMCGLFGPFTLRFSSGSDLKHTVCLIKGLASREPLTAYTLHPQVHWHGWRSWGTFWTQQVLCWFREVITSSFKPVLACLTIQKKIEEDSNIPACLAPPSGLFWKIMFANIYLRMNNRTTVHDICLWRRTAFYLFIIMSKIKGTTLCINSMINCQSDNMNHSSWHDKALSLLFICFFEKVETCIRTIKTRRLWWKKRSIHFVQHSPDAFTSFSSVGLR